MYIPLVERHHLFIFTKDNAQVPITLLDMRCKSTKISKVDI